MKQITIERISFKSFKGIKEFELNLNNKNAVVCGSNASGKTSLADGLQWLFFGKDTKGSKLNPKPLDSNNQEQLGLSPEVEAVFLIDGKQETLKRVQEEKWTAKRGELEKIRSSDTTKYFINGVPTKEKEWKEYLEKIAPEQTLQILSNAAFFMSLEWKERRSTLITFSGLTDEEIMMQDDELKELSKLLDNHSPDEFKKILVGQKKEIKSKIENIPARIQENTDTLEEINQGESEEQLSQSIQKLKKEIVKKEEKLLEENQDDPAVSLKSEVAELELKLFDEKNSYNLASRVELSDVEKKLDDKGKEFRSLIEQIDDSKTKQYRLNNLITSKQQEKDKKLVEYHEIKNKVFDDNQTICPTCHQELPVDEIEKHREDFNLYRSSEMENKITEGKVLAKEIEVSTQELTILKTSEQELQVEKDRINKDIDSLRQEIERLNDSIQDFESTDVYKNIQSDIELLKGKIRNVRSGNSDHFDLLKRQLEQDKQALLDKESKMQQFELAKKIEVRINDLRLEDKELKESYQEVERQLWLVDEFVRRKVERIEQSINSEFKSVKWKLFDIQKNEAIKEMCEATFDGVEYSSSLNTGARVNCDLDIVNTLSHKYRLSLPLFIDNTESVNQLNKVDAQTIELRVTDDKQLKVQV